MNTANHPYLTMLLSAYTATKGAGSLLAGLGFVAVSAPIASPLIAQAVASHIDQNTTMPLGIVWTIIGAIIVFTLWLSAQFSKINRKLDNDNARFAVLEKAQAAAADELKDAKEALSSIAVNCAAIHGQPAQPKGKPHHHGHSR